MSRYWAEVNRGKTSESRAWCEVGCAFEAVDGAHGSYKASQAARRHTEKTGHTTTFDRSYSVFIKGVPRRVPGEEG